MLRAIDNWYLNKEEPNRSCLQALRDWILKFDEHLTEAWKYRMPMFLYKGKMFCYLWQDKKTGQPYLGIVEGGKIDHPLLIQDKRARMRIFYIDPEEDLPLSTLKEILDIAIALY